MSAAAHNRNNIATYHDDLYQKLLVNYEFVAQRHKGTFSSKRIVVYVIVSERIWNHDIAGRWVYCFERKTLPLGGALILLTGTSERSPAREITSRVNGLLNSVRLL